MNVRRGEGPSSKPCRHLSEQQLKIGEDPGECKQRIECKRTRANDPFYLPTVPFRNRDIIHTLGLFT
jgi:hypothetical protein